MSLLPTDWLDHDLESLARLAPIQALDWPELSSAGISVAVKREDTLDPHLGGNKLYKLYCHLQAARANGQRHLVSFGGAWSNHIYALAAAGHSLGLRTTGVIRGERPQRLSPTLADAEAMGMTLLFVSRSDYRLKQAEGFLQDLRQKLGPFYLIPEGGGDALGAAGAAALGRALVHQSQEYAFDVVCCAVGTGATLAGLRVGLPQNVSVCGFSVLKPNPDKLREDNLERVVERLMLASGAPAGGWQLETRYHGGGYARLTDELAQFMLKFEQATGLLLDPVYTAKMVWGIRQKALNGEWPRGTRILVLHSGGLQGRRGHLNKLAAG